METQITLFEPHFHQIIPVILLGNVLLLQSSRHDGGFSDSDYPEELVRASQDFAGCGLFSFLMRLISWVLINIDFRIEQWYIKGKLKQKCPFYRMNCFAARISPNNIYGGKFSRGVSKKSEV